MTRPPASVPTFRPPIARDVTPRRFVRVRALGGSVAALVAGAFVLLAPDVRAQDDPAPPPPPGPVKKPAPTRQDPGKDKIRLSDDTTDRPDGRDPAPKPPDADRAEPPAADTKSEAEAWVDLLAQWPAAEAKQASIRLAAQPSVAWPLLERRMQMPGQDWRMVCGVASTMGKLGDQRAIEPIQGKLQDRALWLHSPDLLDALVRIDPMGAKARLTALLLHPASAVVAEAAKRLEPRLGPPDADALRDVLEAGGPAAREAAVTLLPKTSPETRTSLVAALRDPAPEVAMAAARALADDAAPEAAALTVRAAASPIDRQLAYAALSLSFRAERTGRREVDDPTVRILLGGRGLSGVDPLSRTAAAVVLADLGYHHEIPALEDVLDHRIPDALLECVSAAAFWPDLKVMQPLALRRLQKLTGRTATVAPQEWRSWWEQNRASFHARRALGTIPEGTQSTFSLSIRGAHAPGAEATTIAAGKDGLASAFPDDFVILVADEDAAALVAAVEASQILRRPEVPGGADAAADLEIVVRAGQRERRIAVRAAQGDAAAQSVIDAAESVRRRFAWQRYRSSTQPTDLAEFVARTGARFSEERPEAERRASFADLVTSSIDERRGERWNLRALADLRAVPTLHDALGDEGTRRLLALLGRRPTLDPLAEALVLTLSASQRSEALQPVLDFLLTRGGPVATELLVQVFRDASPGDLAAGLDDARVPVRVAALASLGPESPKALAESAVRKALDAPVVEVRREAVRALGRTRAEWARERIESDASRPGDLRQPALEALGELGGRSALPILMTAFASDDTSLRVTAIRALAATKEPEAFSAIVFAMTYDPDAGAREVASRSIVEAGTERAAGELRRLALDRAQPQGPRARAVLGLSLLLGKEALRDFARLVDDPADEVGDEAALQLARWRDAASVPRLLKMLENERGVRRARIGLECVSLEVFDRDDPQLLANLYAGWWETSKDRGPRGWLVDALVLRGVDDPALRSWESGQSASAAVPFLVRSLRLPDWTVRRAADLVLREMSGQSFGEQEPWSSASDVARMAAAWEDYWGRQGLLE